MPRTLTLTTHAAIRDWVTYRDGKPAISTERDAHGGAHARLMLAFRSNQMRHHIADEFDGISPCSWAAWLAEFDRQRLVLEVVDSDDDNVKQDAIKLVQRETRH